MKKARQKLVGSFSKRKKLRLTSAKPGDSANNNDINNSEFNDELPPPLPKSRPPIPNFQQSDSKKGQSDQDIRPLSSIEKQYLHLTSSLPSNLDSMGDDETDNKNTSMLSSSSSSPSLDDDNMLIPTDCSASVDFRLQATDGLMSTSVFRNYDEGFLAKSLRSNNSETSSETSSGSPLSHRHRDRPKSLPPMLYSPMDTSVSSPDTPITQEKPSKRNFFKNFKSSKKKQLKHQRSMDSISFQAASTEETNAYVTSLFSGISDDSDAGYNDTNYTNYDLKDNDKNNNKTIDKDVKCSDFEEVNDDTDGEGTLICDEDRILTADIGIFEEVFEPLSQESVDGIVSPREDDAPGRRKQSINDNDYYDEDNDGDDSTLDFTISSEDASFDSRDADSILEVKATLSNNISSKQDDAQNNTDVKGPEENVESPVSYAKKRLGSLHFVDKDIRSITSPVSDFINKFKDMEKSHSAPCSPKSPIVINRPFSSPQSPRTPPTKKDTILNKIKFFETISDLDAKDSDKPKSPITSPPPGKLFKDGTDSPTKIESPSIVSQQKRLFSKPPLPLNVNIGRTNKQDDSPNTEKVDSKSDDSDSDTEPNMSGVTKFLSPGVPSPRMNFSRFRKSGSIPETHIACECGRGCENSCPGSRDFDTDGTVDETDEFTEDDDDREYRSEGDELDEDELLSPEEAQVCHHPRCTEDNKDIPLLLCRPCDNNIHRQHEYQGHLVLDYNRKRHIVIRHPSPSPSRSNTYDAGSDSDNTACSNNSNYNYSISNAEDDNNDSSKDQFDDVDGLKLFVKHNSKSRNKSPSELNRKLKRKKALKKKSSNDKPDGLEAALAQIANPEGLSLDLSDMANLSRADSDGPSDSGASNDPATSRRGSTSGQNSRKDSVDSNGGGSDNGLAPGMVGKGNIRRQSRVGLVHESHFTLKFASQETDEDIEVVAAVPNTTLKEAIGHILLRRGLGVDNIHAFIEKSKTPLPLTSDCSFLAGNTLDIKEKDDKDSDIAPAVKLRPGSGPKGSGKAGKASGRNSRRDSVGVVPVLLEPPPSKQRRGSLQLPFREHFFAKTEPKTADGIKGYDDVFGSLRGRNSRGTNLSVDDTSLALANAPSPHGTWNEGKTKTKGQKLSVVSLFGPANKDREKQDQLHEILNRYSSHGLPPVPELLALGRRKFDETIFEMEAHWKELVDNHESIARKDQEHQEAVWELLNTEVSYIRQIRVIIDVFQNCLINIQQDGLLNEIETERLFSNIDKIYECNALFWQQYLLPVLLQGRKFRQPLDVVSCKEAFTVHFPNMFQVYFKYVIEHKSCLEYAKSCTENGELFKSFISWAETQKQCNRLKMADIMVKPMQRLLKYSLLLQAILKHTENEFDKSNIRDMIVAVDKLCWAANTSLQRREDYEKLEAIRKTIDNYDAIEAPNDECAKIVQEFNGNFNLLAPMQGFRDGQPRNQLYKCTLRMKEAQAAKIEVDILLFTDLILICKSNRKMDRFKVIRPPMRLDQLVLNEVKDKGSFLLIYMNEYHVPISAFTFHGDVSVVTAWKERFKDAQKDYKRRKIEESAELERMRASAIPIQEEVQYTPLSALNQGMDITGIPRSESVESTDYFVPNLLAPEPVPIGRCSSTGDIQNRLHNNSNNNSNSNSSGNLEHQSSSSSLSAQSMNPASNGKMPDPNVLSANNAATADAISAQQQQQQQPQQRPLQHRPVQSCNSVPVFPPNSLVQAGGSIGPNPSHSIMHHHTHSHSHPHNSTMFNNANSEDNFSLIVEDVDPRSVRSGIPSSYNHQLSSPDSAHPFTSQTSISSDLSSVFDDDMSKIKLNSRRLSRNEKRYHTADAIEDIKNQEKADRDASIHKRLSMRTDVNMEDDKNLGSKMFSSDSIRSIPSSSGVSSTGSLHLNMESNISEEGEGMFNNNNNNSPSLSVGGRKRHVNTSMDIHTANNNRINQEKSSSKQSNSRFSENNNEHYDDDEEDSYDDGDNSGSDLCPQSKQSKSKSTPDLAAMFSNSLHVSQMEDGVASVAMTVENYHRKLTHADIMRMKRLKQQILIDANIESSEV